MTRTVLRPISWLYQGAIQLRNRCYDTGLFYAERVKVPVVSVGNLSVGGTGKTPLVEHIARHLLEQDERVAVLSRGYKRESTGQVVVSRGDGPQVPPADAGDEPYMLATLLPELLVVVNRDRVAAARYAVSELGATVILLDDGFQHRKIHRDINIVLIPEQDIHNRERVLPEGRLREPWRALQRASHVVITGTAFPTEDESDISGLISEHTHANIYPAMKKTEPVMRSLYGRDSIKIKNEAEHPLLFGIAGTAHPSHFRDALRRLPVNLVEFQEFPDHFAYPDRVQDNLIAGFNTSGANYLVMTAKDYVKWNPARLRQYPIYYLPVTYEFQAPFADEICRRLNHLSGD